MAESTVRQTHRRARRALTLSAIGVLAAGLAVAVASHAGAATAWTNCGGGYVGITFDDGPNAGNTNNLLNALAQQGIKATLFNIGQNAQNNPSLVQAEKNAGMWIGNHSWTHPHLTSMSQSQILSELQRTQQVIQQQTGVAPKLFRPPYGETNATLKGVEQQLGLTEIIWNVDSQDWNGASTAQIVAANNSLQNGQVILMHDFPANTVAAIPQIASNLRARSMCPGMISPATGRAVAPDGGGPTTSPTGGPTASPTGGPTASPTGGSSTPPAGSCTATLSAGQQWSDRYNLNVSVTGSTSWTVTMTVPSPARISATWNISASWTSSQVMVAKPNGGGNTFGVTIMTNGNWNWPTVRCAVG